VVQEGVEGVEVPADFLGLVPAQDNLRELLGRVDRLREGLDNLGPVGDVRWVDAVGAGEADVVRVPRVLVGFWEGGIDARDLC